MAPPCFVQPSGNSDISRSFDNHVRSQQCHVTFDRGENIALHCQAKHEIFLTIKMIERVPLVCLRMTVEFFWSRKNSCGFIVSKNHTRNRNNATKRKIYSYIIDLVLRELYDLFVYVYFCQWYISYITFFFISNVS